MNELFLREKDLRGLTLNCMLSLRQSGTSDAESIKAGVLSAAERALDEPQPAHHSGLADSAASFRTLFDQHRAELHAPARGRKCS